MGGAEVIALNEVRASKQWAALRPQLHERFDQWLETLETQCPEPPSTVPEVATAVWALRQQLTGGITETIVAQVHRSEHDRTQVSCPQCAGRWKAREFVCRTVETLVGPVRLERPYCYCRPCRLGPYPFDAAVGVVTGCKQLDIQQAAAQLVAAVPYDTAQSLFGELTGVPLGSERMHTMANHVAEDLTVVDVAPSCEEIARRVAAAARGWRRPVVVLGIDGA